MASETTITFLGCGTSTGVPMISCNCSVCTSDNPKNNRTRSSIFLQSENTALLIDTGPDLRLQLLREKIIHADAILYTHGHADHTAGMDEIRAFCWRREDRLPLHASEETLRILNRMFPWAFDENYNGRGYVRATGIPFTESFQIGDFTIRPFNVVHGSIDTHGFHITLPSGKTFAYASDMKSLPEEHINLLNECNLHIFDGLRFDKHPSHMTVSEACNLADRLNSPKTILTHLAHDIDYEITSNELPENRFLAYDGLSLTL